LPPTRFRPPFIKASSGRNPSQSPGGLFSSLKQSSMSKPSSSHLLCLPRWFGHRATPPPKRPFYEICIWSFIGSFCGIALIQAVFGHAHYFIRKGAPPVVASYGASAVLIYGAIDKPLSQPRAFVGGHFIGALTGTCCGSVAR
jgi:CBS-domain-containing membrane protein